MKRQPIPFKLLLETVLPVEKLSAREQSRLLAVLAEGIPTQIETAAMEAIDHLTDLGHLRLIEETSEEAGTRRRYQNLLTTDSIVIHIPDALQDQTVHIPLPLRDWKRGTSLDEVRSLFDLYNKMITKDSQLLQAPSDMLRQLLLTTRDLMDCESVTFWSALPGEESASTLGDLNSPVYDENQAREWVLDRRYLVHFPDLPAQIDPETQALDDRFHSMAMVPIGSPAVGIYGVLQAYSSQPRFFHEERQGLLSLVSEISEELLSRAKQLGDLVFVDAATEVYNRSYFNLQLKNEIARAKREDKPLAIAIVDIDDFKAFNSTYGYEGGNQVLTHTAQLLKRGLRPFDSVARWGGEEFALILTPPVTREDAGVVCERLRKSIELSRFTVTGLSGESKSVRLTITIGASMYPRDGEDADALWRTANAALVHGKTIGKNRILFGDDLPEA